MADIKSIAEALVRLSTKEVNELAMVMKDEYDIEPVSQIYHLKEQAKNGRMCQDVPRQLSQAIWHNFIKPKT